MYPFFRMAKELVVHRGKADLQVGDVHVSHHICWPWDLDFWFELNNGRTLTLYDLGRLPLASRLGLIKAMRQQKWGLTVAGVSVRYRRRLRMFQKFEIHSRALGWDERFLYLEQSIWTRNHCANQALYRTAVTCPDGIVAPEKVATAMGLDPISPDLPEWVQNWIKAESTRPWPPEIHATS
ncbi:MAG: thioeseterase [Rhodobacterales bacterium]|nr:MAG: thioeseterase [Rhodobacterales bacterium]